MKKIVNAIIMTPFRYLEGYEVSFEDGKIIEIGKNLGEAEQIFDAKGMYLAPGFIDLHIHGGGGFTFIESDKQKVENALRMSAEHGTTSLYASHMVPIPELSKVYEEVMQKKEGPEILGYHSECVGWDYIYGEERNLNREIPPYTKEMCEEILKSVPVLKKIGIDPMIENAAKATAFFVSKGIKVAISHCGPATPEQVLHCLEAGADCVTHLYTGMFGVYRDQQTGERFPGLIEDCLLEPELTAEVIGNGKHLTGKMLNLIYKMKGTGGMYLTTDSAIREAPFQPGEEMVVPNQLPTRISIKTMAPMDYIVRETVRCSNIPLLEAVRMATYNPAKMANVSNRKGKIFEGYDADLVVFDKDINVKFVVARGAVVKNLL